MFSTAAFHARVRGSVPGHGGLKETKNVSGLKSDSFHLIFTGNAEVGLGQISPYYAGSRLECCLNYDPMLYSVVQP